MRCPRDETELIEERVHGIEVDHCPTCNGRWLDHHELDELESTRAEEAHRSGMIQYAQRDSELKCPVCEKQMVAFNYRAYNLEIDTCHDEHGFWLDAGEEGRVSDIMEERVKGLERAASAEESWGKFLGNMGNKGVWSNIKGMFGGGRRR